LILIFLLAFDVCKEALAIPKMAGRSNHAACGSRVLIPRNGVDAEYRRDNVSGGSHLLLRQSVRHWRRDAVGHDPLWWQRRSGHRIQWHSQR
jgi:hypothetical protein